MTGTPLSVIRVIESGGYLLVSLPHDPELFRAWEGWLKGRRRCWKPKLGAYRIPLYRKAALMDWLASHAHGVEVRWEVEG